ncbi:MAG: N-acetylmuramoyl-L-alanine amidase [Parvibaculum sp.]
MALALFASVSGFATSLQADPALPFARPAAHDRAVVASQSVSEPPSFLRIAELDKTAYAVPSNRPATGTPAESGDGQALANVSGIRLGEHGDETRFVVEMKEGVQVEYQVFTLANPYRVVIDVHNADSTLPDVAGIKGHGIITSYRYGAFVDNIFRIVIDTKDPAAVARNFTLDPQGGFGRRIVLDLAKTDPVTFMASLAVPAANRPEIAASVPAAVVPDNPEEKQTRRRIVVIDPGHGGVDPGTHGKGGTLEKDVVLAFGRELAQRLRDTGRYDVYMTRNKDIFIPLRERVAIARRHKADLFISVHANSNPRTSVKGLSIYTLSEKSSDKEAAALAHKENQSDVIAGIDFQGESPEVTGILIDLAQRETKNYSSRFARSVVDYTRRSTSLLDPAHRFAGFVVLKAPDIPSVLVELGFLTNRSEEKEMTSRKWRDRVSESMVSAVNRYFGDRSAEGGN